MNILIISQLFKCLKFTQSLNWLNKKQLNVEEFKQFKITIHESCVEYQEFSYERMIVQNFV